MTHDSTTELVSYIFCIITIRDLLKYFKISLKIQQGRTMKLLQSKTCPNREKKRCWNTSSIIGNRTNHGIRLAPVSVLYATSKEKCYTKIPVEMKMTLLEYWSRQRQIGVGIKVDTGLLHVKHAPSRYDVVIIRILIPYTALQQVIEKYMMTGAGNNYRCIHINTIFEEQKNTGECLSGFPAFSGIVQQG